MHGLEIVSASLREFARLSKLRAAYRNAHSYWVGRALDPRVTELLLATRLDSKQKHFGKLIFPKLFGSGLVRFKLLGTSFC